MSSNINLLKTTGVDTNSGGSIKDRMRQLQLNTGVEQKTGGYRPPLKRSVTVSSASTLKPATSSPTISTNTPKQTSFSSFQNSQSTLESSKTPPPRPISPPPVLKVQTPLTTNSEVSTKPEVKVLPTPSSPIPIKTKKNTFSDFMSQGNSALKKVTTIFSSPTLKRGNSKSEISTETSPLSSSKSQIAETPSPKIEDSKFLQGEWSTSYEEIKDLYEFLVVDEKTGNRNLRMGGIVFLVKRGNDIYAVRTCPKYLQISKNKGYLSCFLPAGTSHKLGSNDPRAALSQRGTYIINTNINLKTDDSEKVLFISKEEMSNKKMQVKLPSAEEMKHYVEKGFHNQSEYAQPYDRNGLSEVREAAGLPPLTEKN